MSIGYIAIMTVLAVPMFIVGLYNYLVFELHYYIFDIVGSLFILLMLPVIYLIAVKKSIPVYAINIFWGSNLILGIIGAAYFANIYYKWRFPHAYGEMLICLIIFFNGVIIKALFMVVESNRKNNV